MEVTLAEDKLIIETPEQVPLEFQLAGIGSRFLAMVHDTFIQVIVFVVLIVLTILFFAFAAPLLPARIGPWAGAILVLLLFLLQFGYFIFFEIIWNGQTPGKRHQHLRVIKDNGRPITALDAVGRDLMRIVDSLPFFYGIGILSMLLSSKNKRLGDYLVGTVVVHERPLEYTSGVGLQYVDQKAASGYDVTLLTPSEFQFIETFLLRLPQLPAEAKDNLAQEIVERVSNRIGISPEDRRSPILYLQKVAAEYRNKAGFR
jgi:uncharacterized RDD family membrane protein YckC